MLCDVHSCGQGSIPAVNWGEITQEHPLHNHRLTDSPRMWRNFICETEIREEIAAWYNSQFQTIASSYKHPGSNYHTRTQMRRCCVPPTECKHRIPAVSLLQWTWPHVVGLLLRGKLIFCYYFSCVWCKMAHYIFQERAVVSGKLESESNYAVNIHSQLICKYWKMDLIKQNNTHSRYPLILIGDGDK